MSCIALGIVASETKVMEELFDVRFGSKADMCGAAADVRFTLNSDRESGFPQKAMSALPPKADMCGALAHVCYVPIADVNARRHLARVAAWSGTKQRS